MKAPFEVDVTRFIGKARYSIERDNRHLKKVSARQVLVNQSHFDFVVMLLEREIQDKGYHPNTLAYLIGISNTKLFRIMTGYEYTNLFSVNDLIKILNYFGFDLNVKIEPMKQKKQG